MGFRFQRVQVMNVLFVLEAMMMILIQKVYCSGFDAPTESAVSGCMKTVPVKKIAVLCVYCVVHILNQHCHDVDSYR